MSEMTELEKVFGEIFSTEIERRQVELKKERVAVHVLIGKLGLHHGKQKILGIYPTAQQAEERKDECIKDHDTLFRRYMVAQVYVSVDGAACDIEF